MKKFVALIFILIFEANAYAGNVTNTDLCLRDCKMELQFFKRYAQQGSSIANLALAIMNYRGQGTDIDIKAGNKFLIKSARAGEPAAQYQLGYFLMHGIFMPKDLSAALQWFKKSARYNLLDSQEKVDFLTKKLQAYKAPTMTIEESISHLVVSDLDTNEDSNSLSTKDLNEKARIRREKALMLSTDIETITIRASFNWADVLNAAKNQTCNNPSCKTFFRTKALIPRIVLKEEQF